MGENENRTRIVYEKIPSDVAWRYLNEIDQEEYLAVLRDLLASKRKSVRGKMNTNSMGS